MIYSVLILHELTLFLMHELRTHYLLFLMGFEIIGAQAQDVSPKRD